jgi:carbon storage regulator CsrA
MMLVLTRKRGESVRITVGGFEVSVRVGRVKQEQVRLEFEAPPEVKILRAELPLWSENLAIPKDGQ